MNVLQMIRLVNADTPKLDEVVRHGEHRPFVGIQIERATICQPVAGKRQGENCEREREFHPSLILGGHGHDHRHFIARKLQAAD